MVTRGARIGHSWGTVIETKDSTDFGNVLVTPWVMRSITTQHNSLVTRGARFGHSWGTAIEMKDSTVFWNSLVTHGAMRYVTIGLLNLTAWSPVGHGLVTVGARIGHSWGTAIETKDLTDFGDSLVTPGAIRSVTYTHPCGKDWSLLGHRNQNEGFKRLCK